MLFTTQQELDSFGASFNMPSYNRPQNNNMN